MINYKPTVLNRNSVSVKPNHHKMQEDNISFQGNSRFLNIVKKQNIIDLGVGACLATIATAYIFNKEITHLEEKAYDFFDKNYKNTDNLVKILNGLDDKTKVFDPLSIIIGDKNFLYLWLLSNHMEQRKQFLRATCYLKLANNSNPDYSEEYLQKAKFYYHKVEDLIEKDRTNLFGKKIKKELVDDNTKLASINNNLGNTYLQLSRLRERKNNLSKSIDCYLKGLNSYNNKIIKPNNNNMDEYNKHLLNKMTLRNNLAKSYGILSRIKLINKTELQQSDELYSDNLKDCLLLFAQNFLVNKDPTFATQINKYIKNTKDLMDKKNHGSLFVKTVPKIFEKFELNPALEEIDIEFKQYLLNDKDIQNILLCSKKNQVNINLPTEEILEALLLKYPYINQVKVRNRSLEMNMKEITNAYAISLNNTGCLSLEGSRFCDDNYNKMELILNSIKKFNKCLHIYNMVNTPYQNSKIRLNLAKAYMSMAEIEPDSNLNAILKQLARKCDNDYCNILESLAQINGKGIRETVLLKAKNLYTESISIFCSPKTHKSESDSELNNYENNVKYITDLREYASAYENSVYPEEYAKTKIDLGIVYTELSLSNPANKRLILKALESEIDALSIIKKNLVPEEYAKGINNIGIIYQRLASSPNYFTDDIIADAIKLLEEKQLLKSDQLTKSNIDNRTYLREKSIELFRRCKALYPKEIYPKGYFQSEINLAIAEKSLMNPTRTYKTFQNLQDNYTKYYDYENKLNNYSTPPMIYLNINNKPKLFKNEEIVNIIKDLGKTIEPNSNLYYRSTIPRYEEMNLLRFHNNEYLPKASLYSKLCNSIGQNIVLQSIFEV